VRPLVTLLFPFVPSVAIDETLVVDRPLGL
jgi:hypothetical protein